MRASFEDKFGDVHTRLMMKNYDAVPQWWFYTILMVVIGLALLACEGFGRQLQLPYWGVLLAISLALLFTLPIGVITATTNQVIYMLQFTRQSHFWCIFNLSEQYLSVEIYVGKTKQMCAATRTKCNHGVDYWLHVSRETTCQCGLQDLRLHKHVAGYNVSLRFQARSLYENPSKVHVHCSGNSLINHLIY